MRPVIICLTIFALLLAGCSPAAPTASVPTSVPPTAAPTIVAAASTPGIGTAEVEIEPVKPTQPGSAPTLIGTPPADGGAFSGSGTAAADGKPTVLKPPPTLADLVTQFPDLQLYIDSVQGKQLDGIDLTDLYRRIAQIYEKNGAAGVATFLKDSSILDKLGIPLSYLDLLIAYGDNGDLAAVDKLARARKLINDKNEVVGYLTLDSKGSVDSVTQASKALGLSIYDFNENTDELEIGIPLEILGQMQTPGKLINYLAKIAHMPHVVGFRPPAPPAKSSLSVDDAQKLAAQGPKTIGADKWQAAGITGKGVKIGVLDMGFGGILKRVGKELPAADKIHSLQSLDDLDSQGEDHGTACAMIVHAAAPDAELYIAQFSGGSRGSFRTALNYLIKSKVQIISFSVGSPVGPRDGTFGWALTVDEVTRDNGILWVNAAGNDATDHTAFKYKDNGQGIHDFGKNVEALAFRAAEPITTVIMNWDGNWNGGEKDEYDFTIQDKDGNELVSAAEARQGRKGDVPYQIGSFEIKRGKTYYMVIQRKHGTADHVLDIFIPNGELVTWAQVPDHSVSTPGDSNGALTVGATGLTVDQLEDYSSQGPTMDERIKPDLTAPTGERLPGYEDGFAGTSGSAPLVAGAAGLVFQKFPDMKAEEVRAFLLNNSKDLGKKGADPLYGSGRLALPAPGRVNTNAPSANANTDATQAPAPSTSGATATIKNVDTQYNVKVKGQKGLGINVSFDVENFKGKKGLVAVLFFDDNNKPIPGSDPDYTVGKALGVGLPFSPKYDQSSFDNVLLFVPNAALKQIPRSMSQINYIVGIVDLDNAGKLLAASDPVAIKIKR